MLLNSKVFSFFGSCYPSDRSDYLPPLPTWDQWKLVTQHVFVLWFSIELLNCFPTNTKYSLGLNRLVDSKNIWHITGIWEDLLIALKIYPSLELELKGKTIQTACCLAYKHWHCSCWNLVEQVHTSKSEIPVQSMRKETNKSYILGRYLCMCCTKPKNNSRSCNISITYNSAFIKKLLIENCRLWVHVKLPAAFNHVGVVILYYCPFQEQKRLTSTWSEPEKVRRPKLLLGLYFPRKHEHRN